MNVGEFSNYNPQEQEKLFSEKKSELDQKIKRLQQIEVLLKPLEQKGAEGLQQRAKLLIEEASHIKAFLENELSNEKGVFIHLLKSKAEHAIHNLERKESFDAQDIEEIISFKSLIVNYISYFDKDSSVHKLYKEKVVPLEKRALKVLSHVSIPAAEKGKALQAGLEAMTRLQKMERSVLPMKGVSSQEVYVLQKAGAVLKKSKAKPKEEESQIQQLFDLLSSKAIVPQFQMDTAAPHRFGIPLVSQQEMLRGFTLSDIALRKPAFAREIRDNLTADGDEVLGEIDRIGYETQKIKEFREAPFFYKKEGSEEWEQVSFADLFQRYNKGVIASGDQMKRGEGNSFSLYETSSDQKLLMKAFQQPNSDASQPNVLFYQKFKDQQDAKLYEVYERCKWAYKGKEMTFKEVHELFLEVGEQVLNDVVVLKGADVDPKKLRDLFLNIEWDVQLPTLRDRKGKVLKDFVAKPFVENMLLFSQLVESEELKQGVMRRLGPTAEYQALLTLEFQLLDLHVENLGAQPVPSAAYERVKKVSVFQVDRYGVGEKGNLSNLSFKELLELYVKGKIPDDRFIQFKLDGISYKGKIKDLKELHEALNAEWQFAIFDTDRCLAETNMVHRQVNRTKEGLAIPLRSTLLETEWKDHPLSDETLKQLQENDQKEAELIHWMRGEDRPVFQRMAQNKKEGLFKLLEPQLAEYTLGELRKNLDVNSGTVKDLSQQFSQVVVDIQKKENIALWEEIQDLLSYSAKDNDTLVSIAKKEGIKLKALMAFNPHIDPRDLIAKGAKVVLQDLTSNTAESLLARKKIAPQLFPRLTIAQQHALLERRHARRQYLENYTELSKLQEQDLSKEKLLNFVKSESTPFHTNLRKNLIQQINDSKDKLELKSLHKTIIRLSKPTYFNIAKAMYPLLADVFSLSSTLYGGTEGAGISIGQMTTPVDAIFNYPETKGLERDELWKRLQEEKKRAPFYLNYDRI